MSEGPVSGEQVLVKRKNIPTTKFCDVFVETYLAGGTLTDIAVKLSTPNFPVKRSAVQNRASQLRAKGFQLPEFAREGGYKLDVDAINAKINAAIRAAAVEA